MAINTQKKVPLRKCIGCQEMKPKKELIRVLRTPEGEITLDETGRANGRGAYLCRSEQCLKRAIKSRGLSRSLQTEIPEEVFGRLSEEIKGFETT